MADLSVAVCEQLWNEAQLQNRVTAPVFRLWRYRQPVVVLGCSQRRLLAEVDAHTDLEVLLRESGGGAVLTGPWMLGLSVALPLDHPLVSTSPVGSYRWLGETIAQTLQDCGVPADAVAPQDLRARVAAGAPTGPDWACFGGLSPWEILSSGRKIAGLAQVRRAHGVLLVGGVLLDRSPWTLLCETLARPTHDAQQLADITTHGRAAGGSTFERASFEQRLERALQACLNREVCPA
jgi:lipoate-protein ligase A